MNINMTYIDLLFSKALNALLPLEERRAAAAALREAAEELGRARPGSGRAALGAYARAVEASARAAVWGAI